MSSTSVMIGPIYAQRASRRSIQLNLSVLFLIDLSRTSDGVQSRTSTAGIGVVTMATLRHRQTSDSQTFHRFGRAGDLAVEIAIENSRPAGFCDPRHDLLRYSVASLMPRRVALVLARPSAR